MHNSLSTALTTDHQPLTTIGPPLTTDEQRLLAEELSGCPRRQLLKVRATPDSLVVVIHTGQKFIYDLAAIQAGVERLATRAGRLAREAALGVAAPEAEPAPAPRARQRPADRSKRP